MLKNNKYRRLHTLTNVDLHVTVSHAPHRIFLTAGLALALALASHLSLAADMYIEFTARSERYIFSKFKRRIKVRLTQQYITWKTEYTAP